MDQEKQLFEKSEVQKWLKTINLKKYDEKFKKDFTDLDVIDTFNLTKLNNLMLSSKLKKESVYKVKSLLLKNFLYRFDLQEIDEEWNLEKQGISDKDCLAIGHFLSHWKKKGKLKKKKPDSPDLETDLELTENTLIFKNSSEEEKKHSLQNLVKIESETNSAKFNISIKGDKHEFEAPTISAKKDWTDTLENALSKYQSMMEQVTFQCGETGLSFDEKKITKVAKDSQAEFAGICKGWEILEVREKPSDKLIENIEEIKTVKNNKSIVIKFQKTVYALKVLNLCGGVDWRGQCIGKISDAGAIALADSLRINSTLTKLNLSQNRIGDAGAIAIGHAFQNNNTLKSLDIRHNTTIALTGGQSLADAIFGSTTIQYFSGIQVEYLKRSNPFQKTSENDTNPDVINLASSGCGLTEALVLGLLLTLESGSKKPQAAESTNVLDKAYILENNPTLTAIPLNGNDINLLGAKTLADVKKVTMNSIPLTQIQGKEHLDLSSEIYKDLDALIIASVLKNNTILTDINLKRNEITHLGAKVLAKALFSIKTLKKITMNGEIPLDKFQQQDATIDLSSKGYQDTDAIIIAEFLTPSSNIKTLDMRKNLGIGKMGSKILSKAIDQNKKIEHFGNINLKDLDSSNKDFSNNNCGDTEARVIGLLLKKNSIITDLNLSNNEIGDIGAEGLADGLKENDTLKHIDLRKNSRINEIGITSLSKVIFESKKIRHFGGINWKDSIDKMNFSSTDCGDIEALVIGLLLKKNSIINDLNLSNNKIGDIGAKGLADGLKENNTLTRFDLRENSRINAIGSTSLSKAIVGSKKIQVFGIIYVKSFRENSGESHKKKEYNEKNLGDTEALVIGSLLKENHTITELNLSNNDVGDIGVIGLVEGLKENSTITELNLSNNDVGDIGVIGLVEGLKVNTVLKKLNIQYNLKITKVGKEALQKIRSNNNQNVKILFNSV